jgi:hypothetical protein
LGKAPAIVTDTNFKRYYSHSFGCWVESREHKAALEKKHGVTPVTLQDIEDSNRIRGRKRELTDRRLDREDEEIERSPHYAKFREMRARGYFTQHLKGEARRRAQAKLDKRAREVRGRRTK